jgi:hypothetical protein
MMKRNNFLSIQKFMHDSIKPVLRILERNISGHNGDLIISL